MQPTHIGLGTQSTDSGLLSLDYSYGTTHNNGNVRSQTISLPGLSLVQSYTYDEVNRLQSAHEASGQTETWRQEYRYTNADAQHGQYGNRRLSVAQTSWLVTEHPEFNPTNNRIVAQAGEQYMYDAVGNLTRDKDGNTFAYDGENRQTTYNGGASVNGGATYSYDGDGRRVKKVAGVVLTIFVYDVMGQLVAEYSSEAPTENGTQYLTADHLGTPRVVTGADGVVKARHDYLPFGEEIGADVGGRTGKGYVADNVRQQFTGYERDHETDLDYAHARYYANTQGRFTSPDPLLSSSSIYDPQTWNRYSYTLNNPLKHTDPTGLYIWSATLGGGLTDEQLRTLANNENLGEDRQIYQRALDARAAFRNALAAAATARDALPAGAERDLVSASLSSYGAEGVANGVSVGRGRLADGVTAEARTRFETDQQAPFATRALVEVVLSDRGGGDLANDVAHEGRHVADAQAFATAFSSEVANGGTGENAVAGALNMTRYERESRGYTVSSLIAQGQGLNNYSVGRREIWNRGWAQADRATLRTAAIDNLLRESPTYRLTPRNPGGRFIPRP